MNRGKAEPLLRAAVWLGALMLWSVEHHFVARFLIHALRTVHWLPLLIEAALNSKGSEQVTYLIVILIVADLRSKLKSWYRVSETHFV